MKELLSRGFGTKVKQTDPILPEVEEKIWEAKILECIQRRAYNIQFFSTIANWLVSVPSMNTEVLSVNSLKSEVIITGNTYIS